MSEETYVMVPRVATPYQYEAMQVFAEIMLSTVNKLDVGLIYACGVEAGLSEAATPNE